jgi:hypothetical protein
MKAIVKIRLHQGPKLSEFVEMVDQENMRETLDVTKTLNVLTEYLNKAFHINSDN